MNFSRARFSALMLVLLVTSLACIAQTPEWDWHRWNWHNARKLDAGADQLRDSKLSKQEKSLLAAALAEQIRPGLRGLGLPESEVQETALDTRIKQMRLATTSGPEVIAQPIGRYLCGATGNCSLWIFQRTTAGYKLILSSEAETFTVQPTSTNGFRDIVLALSHSALESGVIAYKYVGGSYHEAACANAAWSLQEGEPPRFSPCH